ncbi:MAG: hypothetical protein CMJ21_00800 [Phycisphaerae bacterium]|nr:hypothetical protein [Phycisphaerae bacterium]
MFTLKVSDEVRKNTPDISKSLPRSFVVETAQISTHEKAVPAMMQTMQRAWQIVFRCLSARW